MNPDPSAFRGLNLGREERRSMKALRLTDAQKAFIVKLADEGACVASRA